MSTDFLLLLLSYFNREKILNPGSFSFIFALVIVSVTMVNPLAN